LLVSHLELVMLPLVVVGNKLNICSNDPRRYNVEINMAMYEGAALRTC